MTGRDCGRSAAFPAWTLFCGLVFQVITGPTTGLLGNANPSWRNSGNISSTAVPLSMLRTATVTQQRIPSVLQKREKRCCGWTSPGWLREALAQGWAVLGQQELVLQQTEIPADNKQPELSSLGQSRFSPGLAYWTSQGTTGHRTDPTSPQPPPAPQQHLSFHRKCRKSCAPLALEACLPSGLLQLCSQRGSRQGSAASPDSVHFWPVRNQLQNCTRMFATCQES